MTISSLNSLIESKKTPITVAFTTRNTPDDKPLVYGRIEQGVGFHRSARTFYSEEDLLAQLDGIE